MAYCRLTRRMVPSLFKFSPISPKAGIKAERIASINTRPFSSAISNSRSSSRRLLVTVFSHSTCLPWDSISAACSKCRLLGLAI